MTITDTRPALTMSAMTDAELLELFRSDGTAAAEALAECDRRDRAARMERPRRALDEIRGEGERQAYASYRAADAACCGELLSKAGKAAFDRGEITSETALWRMPAERAQLFASEELLDHWLYAAPRITPADYVRQQAAERRKARTEARDNREAGSEELAGHEAGALRRGDAAEDTESAGGAGRAVQRRGHSAAEGEAGQDGTADGRSGRPVQRDGLESKGAGTMGVITAGIRAYERADREKARQAEADTPAPGSTPPQAAADCSTEAASLAGLTEEELQEFGQAMLEEACQFIDRFSVLPSRAATYSLALFAASNWIYRAFTDSPRFHISALTYGAGKTRVMELVSQLCPNPQMMAKITGPALYHIIDERHPAPLCLDEADVIFGGGQRGEELRGILNAGYKYNGTITRVVKGEAADFSVYCPAMFAGKGKLPKSLEDRAVTIMMAQRKPGQQMDRFIPKMHDAMGRKIGLMLGAWATRIQGPAGDILWDEPPVALADRQVDILTPLYAIAQMAAGPWPDRFAEMVDVLVLGGVSTDEVSPATELLALIAEVWPEDTERLATHQLAALVAEHESGKFPWPESQRTAELNARMRDMGVPPVPMRIDGKVMRGYDRESVTGTGVTPDSDTTSDLRRNTPGV